MKLEHENQFKQLYEKAKDEAAADQQRELRELRSQSEESVKQVGRVFLPPPFAFRYRLTFSFPPTFRPAPRSTSERSGKSKGLS